MPAVDCVHEVAFVFGGHAGLRRREDVEAEVVPDLVQAGRRLSDVDLLQECEVVDARDRKYPHTAAGERADHTRSVPQLLGEASLQVYRHADVCLDRAEPHNVETVDRGRVRNEIPCCICDQTY